MRKVYETFSTFTKNSFCGNNLRKYSKKLALTENHLEDKGFFFHGITFDWRIFCTFLNLAQLAS